ncbi:MAG: response regulator [Desulfovibrio sp.]|nr:MAG: response regulator [Desulfovibrio sp.]
MEQEGFTVTEVVGEDEAKEALTRQIPDLVVMRFMMPTAQEFKLANIIATNKALTGVPVMMLTVKDAANERFLMSLDRYFPNPVKASSIVSEISVIGRKQGPVRSVLVADDGPKLVQSMTDFLNARGLNVSFAFDQAETLRLAGEERPDLIIVGALMAQRHNMIANLRFDMGLSKMQFILLGGNNA